MILLYWQIKTPVNDSNWKASELSYDFPGPGALKCIFKHNILGPLVTVQALSKKAIQLFFNTFTRPGFYDQNNPVPQGFIRYGPDEKRICNQIFQFFSIISGKYFIPPEMITLSARPSILNILLSSSSARSLVSRFGAPRPGISMVRQPRSDSPTWIPLRQWKLPDALRPFIRRRAMCVAVPSCRNLRNRPWAHPQVHFQAVTATPNRR